MLEFKLFLSNLLGTIKATLRLLLLTINFLLAGLNYVWFAGREIADFDFVFDYLSQDIDKLTYIDKLNSQIGDFEDEEGIEGIYLEGEDEDYE
jgi:hypothetical protein